MAHAPDPTEPPIQDPDPAGTDTPAPPIEDPQPVSPTDFKWSVS